MLIAYALTKLSIIYFLRRLFVVGKTGPFHWITNSLVVVVLLWLISILVFFVISHTTDSTNTASMSVLHFMRGEVGMAASDSALDIVIFILPFPMVRTQRPQLLS